MDAPNNQISTIDGFMDKNTKYNDDKTLFQNNFAAPNNFNKSSFDNMNNFPNFSVSRTQGAQYSKASVTKTTTNRMITKRIIRKIVNGEVVEEEEEIDEIEKEPQTEQIVVNNASHFDNVDMKVGGKFFGLGKKEGLSVKAKDKNEANKNNLKAIEPPKEKTGLSRIFSMGKKKKRDFNSIGKIVPIIDELLTTEENYVKDLQLVVEELMPEVDKSIAPAEIRGENRHLLFGNLEIISMFHDVQFKTDLNEADKTPDDIASCFIKHRKEFSLYRHFNRNQPTSEVFLGKYEPFFQQKVSQLGGLGLRSYLIKPTQRLCRYILLMEELGKECKKHNIKSKDVEEAILMLKTEIRLGNDLMALDAIKGCDMDLKDQGELIYRNQFTVQQGKDPEFKAMVFLFEKIMLFTSVKLENNVDVLYFQGYICLKDIGLTECSNDAKKFKVWFHKHTLKPYTLKTSDKETKKKWVSEIRKQLENELATTIKEKQVTRTLIDLNIADQEKTSINNKP